MVVFQELDPLDAEMSTTRVVLKLPNGRNYGPYSINSTAETVVFRELLNLFRVITQLHICLPGTQFFVEIPDCAGSLYIAFPPTTGAEDSSPETMEVYVIKMEQGEQLSEGEVRNRFYDSFGKQLEYAMSVVYGGKTEKRCKSLGLPNIYGWCVYSGTLSTNFPCRIWQ